jgi:putative ABC transport system ATP-binding protein/lipoprotein-releasing system ATP-binding protein
VGLELVQVEKSFGEPPTQVLKGISLSVADGEFVSITGRSGSGKSTLLYVLSTLDFASAGSVTLDGQGVEAMAPEALHRFRNQRMGFVFQASYLLPELTVLENVLMPARKLGRHRELQARALELLARVGLTERQAYLPGRISGGEKQRAVIARALVMSPKYIFADEPTGNLDTENGETVLRIFQQINRDLGSTVIFVTHDPEFAARAGRRIVIRDGQVDSDQRPGG